MRQTESEPLINELKRRLTGLLEGLSVKSTLAKAIRYTLRHWDGLTMFLSDGRVEVNSDARASVRTIAQGRHSYLRRFPNAARAIGPSSPRFSPRRGSTASTR